MKKISRDLVALTLILIVALSRDSLAASDQAVSFVNNLRDWIIFSIGPGIVAIGLAMGAMAFFKSEQEGIKKAITVIAGGGIMALATFISDLI